MRVNTKDGREVYLRRLTPSDLDNLLGYLDHLSNETKKRFGPHQFDKQSVIDFYNQTTNHFGYVALTIDTNTIVAYSIIKLGYLEGDYNRFLSYGIQLDNQLDCAFAPSVADLWQSCGIGNQLFQFILDDLKTKEIKRIVLWGGVQADNQRAVNFYKKNNFTITGQFSYYGENFDMVLTL